MIAVILFAGIVWNLPDSPIKRALQPAVQPTTAVTLNQNWAVFAPDPPMRRDTVEVRVTMADGTTRVWTRRASSGVNRLLATSRWQRLLLVAVLDAGARPGIARWVVRQVTDPSEHPVGVEMILRTETLPPPGQSGRGATAEKVLYQEELAAPR